MKNSIFITETFNQYVLGMLTTKRILFLAGLALAFWQGSVVDAAALSPAPNVQITADHFLQADTFLVKVINEKNTISGTFGLHKLQFFRSQDGKDWVAIVGISVHKPPGTYKLAINVSGKEPFKKSIVIGEKKFPITQLVITPAQKQQGYTVKKLLRNIKSNAVVSLDTILNIFTVKKYFTKPFALPLALIKITGDYGDIRESNGYKVQHLGVDLEAAVGTPVMAVNDGKVVFAKSLPDYGNTLVINHGFGIYSLYLHLSKFNVTLGTIVHQGDTIAYSGDTGYVLGPHLHFSIKFRGASVDPLAFIQATQNGW